MRLLLIIWLLVVSCPASSEARVDTIKGAANVEDALIYGYPTCDPEAYLEDCRRYNAGGVGRLSVGEDGIDECRGLISLPGWDGLMPDSSTLLLYCCEEADAADRRVFLYPLSRSFIVGTENVNDVGAYPVSDSGVTWNHAWLDIGDADSLLWDNPGGDFQLAPACTTVVTSSGAVCAFRGFNRVLQYWDTTAGPNAVILIGAQEFPVNTSRKTFVSTEGVAAYRPALLLYHTDSTVAGSRRRRAGLQYGRP